MRVSQEEQEWIGWIVFTSKPFMPVILNILLNVIQMITVYSNEILVWKESPCLHINQMETLEIAH